MAKFSYRFVWQNKGPLTVNFLSLFLICWLLEAIIYQFYPVVDPDIREFISYVIFGVVSLLFQYNLIQSIVANRQFRYNPLDSYGSKGFHQFCGRVMFLMAILVSIVFLSNSLNDLQMSFTNDVLQSSTEPNLSTIIKLCVIVAFDLVIFISIIIMSCKISYYLVLKCNLQEDVSFKQIILMKKIAWPAFKAMYINAVMLLPIMAIFSVMFLGLHMALIHFIQSFYSRFVFVDIFELAVNMCFLFLDIGIARYVAVHQ